MSGRVSVLLNWAKVVVGCSLLFALFEYAAHGHHEAHAGLIGDKHKVLGCNFIGMEYLIHEIASDEAEVLGNERRACVH